MTGPARSRRPTPAPAFFAAALAAVCAACGAPPRVVPVLQPLPALPPVDPDAVPPAGSVPAPASVLGLDPAGDTGAATPGWEAVTAYLSALGAASPRVRVDTVGPSTFGRPFLLVAIADPATLARLELHQSVQQRFADPRRIPSPAELERMIARGRAVVLVAGAGRADPPGEAAAALRIAHRLASGDGPLERAVLAGTIVLLAPSLNPDGVDRFADWRERARGEVWADAPPPFLAHPYAGDGVAADIPGITQVETRLLVERVLRAWHPHAVHLIGSRADAPADGGATPWPALLSPLTVASEVQGGRAVVGSDAYRAAGAGAAGSPGADRGEEARVLALLETAAARRESWLRKGVRQARAAVGPDTGASAAGWALGPAGPVCARDDAGRRPTGTGSDTARPAAAPGLADLLRILAAAGVEVRRALAPLCVDGRRLAEGTYIVPAHQPGARFARAVLGGGAADPARRAVVDVAGRAVADPARRAIADPAGRPIADAAMPRLPVVLGVEMVPFALPDRKLADLRLSRPVTGPPVRREAVGLSGAGGAAPRIAVYRGDPPSPGEGWTRWLLDAYRIPYATVRDEDIRRRTVSLADRFDVLVLPAQASAAIYAGLPPGTAPEAYADGLGAAGTAALAAFVHAGGTLVALGRASRYPIEYLGVPVRAGALAAAGGDADAASDADASARTFVTVEVDTSRALGAGSPAVVAAWTDGALELRPTHSAAGIVARYAEDDGAGAAAASAAGAGALVVVPMGEGRVVLFGFRPNYRGLSTPTLPLFFNALRSAGGRPASPPT